MLSRVYGNSRITVSDFLFDIVRCEEYRRFVRREVSEVICTPIFVWSVVFVHF